jgi:hypothetical protein
LTDADGARILPTMPFSNLLYHLFWLELALYGTKQSGLITFERTNVVIAAVYNHLTCFF